jgi:hypothetical protein
LVRYTCNKGKKGGILMKRIYYKAIEKTKMEERVFNIRLSYSKPDDKFCTEFETIKEAKRSIEKAINGRKRQMFYYRNKNGEIVDKISYYDKYEITYKIIKVVEETEKVFECDNGKIERKEIDKELREEMPI